MSSSLNLSRFESFKNQLKIRSQTFAFVRKVYFYLQQWSSSRSSDFNILLLIIDIIIVIWLVFIIIIIIIIILHINHSKDWNWAIDSTSIASNDNNKKQ